MAKSLGKYVHYAIALLLFLIVMCFLPAGNGLTLDGVHLLAVLFPVIYLWITVGTDWVSLLGLGALVMTGVMTNGKNFYADVYAGSMGNFIIITVIACMALSAVLSQTGVIEKIANWFISRKFCRGNGQRFLAMFILSFFVVGTFMEATAVTIMYIDLAKEILAKLGYKKGDKFYTAMMAGIYWGNAVVSAGSPISHVLPLLIMAAAAPALGASISFGQWLMVGIPFEIVSYFIAIFIFKFIWKPDTSRFKEVDIDSVIRAAQPLSKQAKITIVLFVIVVVAWLFPQFGQGLFPSAVAYLNNIGACVPPILAIAAVCIIRVDGEPIARFPEIVKSIPMGLLIFTATVTVFGAAINLESCGVSAWMTNLLEPVMSGLPPVAIVALLAFGGMLLTQFMSNTVTAYVFYALAISLLASTGVNVAAAVIIVSLASFIGLLTPAAAVPAPLFFGPEHITVKNTAKPCIVFLVLSFAQLMLLMWPLASALIVL